MVVDVRHPVSRHRVPVANAVALPFTRAFINEAGACLDRPGPVVVLADNRVIGDMAGQALERLGFTVAGIVPNVKTWVEAGFPVVRVPQVTVEQLWGSLTDWTVVDVREPYEWRSGTVPGALRMPLGRLAETMGNLDRSRRYAAVCAHGNRSQVAAGYLAERGFDVVNVEGGMALWLMRGLPVEW
jgi:rhodanese-related sulfurtransferase